MKDAPPLIFEDFSCSEATPKMMDRWWAQGWRHFGAEFFRYSISFGERGQQTIQPLRIALGRWELSKSQRRVLRQNAEVRVSWVAASLHEEVCEIFQRHKQRFQSNVPEHLRDFLGDPPGCVVPCEECQVWLGKRLIAASFMESSETAASGVYGVFDPADGRRSLGIFTMLTELAEAQRRGLQYYYSGYATREPSHYDYKKRFAGLEIYDWREERWVAQGT